MREQVGDGRGVLEHRLVQGQAFLVDGEVDRGGGQEFGHRRQLEQCVGVTGRGDHPAIGRHHSRCSPIDGPRGHLLQRVHPTTVGARPARVADSATSGGRPDTVNVL